MKAKTLTRKNRIKKKSISVASDKITRESLETAINQSLFRKELDAACLLIDQYLLKFETDLSYHQLCVIANALCLNYRLEEAFKVCMRAMRMDANAPAAPEILFWIYQNKGDKQALKVIDRLIESGPAERRSDYLYWKAIYANNHSLPDTVLSCIEEAGGPPHPSFEKYQEVTYSLIVALCMLDMIDEAEHVASSVPEALMFQTRYLPMAFAQIKQARGLHEDVVAIYDQFLDKNPDVVEARWNRALANLTVGRLTDGWQDFECRWDWKGYPSREKKLSIPKWQGEDLEGKSVLLWAEQGMGDQILFLTLALPLIRDSQIKVAIEVDAKLVNIVSLWYPEAEVKALEKFDCEGLVEYETFDYQLPLGSLMQYFLVGVSSLHERPIRFLRSNQSLRSDLVERAALNPELPIIGLCWRSSFVNSARTVGYLNVDAMVRIIKDLSGAANFVSLQYAMTGEEIEALSVFDNVYVPPENFFTDVASHAQHIGICDVVLTAGTLTSQLAGVFNRNTLTWGVGGWTFLGQRQYPWYPNHAALKLSPNVSKSSLVFQITKWLKVILGNRVYDDVEK